jgi:hypothetical protein
MHQYEIIMLGLVYHGFRVRRVALSVADDVQNSRIFTSALILCKNSAAPDHFASNLHLSFPLRRLLTGVDR